MKQIIGVKVKTRQVDFTECKTDVLVVGRFVDGGPDEVIRALDRKLDGGIARLAKLI